MPCEVGGFYSFCRCWYPWMPASSVLWTDSTNVFTSLLPRNSDHVIIHLGGYNCAICHAQLSAWGYIYVQTEQLLSVTFQINNCVIWIGWQQACKHIIRIPLFNIFITSGFSKRVLIKWYPCVGVFSLQIGSYNNLWSKECQFLFSCLLTYLPSISFLFFFLFFLLYIA